MIRVAAGEKLPLQQKDVKIDGWAMECRINAEDPFRGFLPSTGRLVKCQPPAEDPVRWRACRYRRVRRRRDPDVLRLDDRQAHRARRDRNEAIARMRAALNGFVIRGISSNIPFQAALLAAPAFVTGDFNTGFIAEHYSKGFKAEDVPHDDPAFLIALAAFVRRKARERAAGISGQLPGHESASAARPSRSRARPSSATC
jgi:propionyl-CoA carboxylase alpha chain